MACMALWMNGSAMKDEKYASHAQQEVIPGVPTQSEEMALKTLGSELFSGEFGFEKSSGATAADGGPLDPNWRDSLRWNFNFPECPPGFERWNEKLDQGNLEAIPKPDEKKRREYYEKMRMASKPEEKERREYYEKMRKQLDENNLDREWPKAWDDEEDADDEVEEILSSQKVTKDSTFVSGKRAAPKEPDSQWTGEQMRKDIVKAQRLGVKEEVQKNEMKQKEKQLGLMGTNPDDNAKQLDREWPKEWDDEEDADDQLDEILPSQKVTKVSRQEISRDKGTGKSEDVNEVRDGNKKAAAAVALKTQHGQLRTAEKMNAEIVAKRLTQDPLKEAEKLLMQRAGANNENAKAVYYRKKSIRGGPGVPRPFLAEFLYVPLSIPVVALIGFVTGSRVTFTKLAVGLGEDPLLATLS